MESEPGHRGTTVIVCNTGASEYQHTEDTDFFIWINIIWCLMGLLIIDLNTTENLH